jgi:sterol desaturase/sphingolipid hydroxylase (fatty acid hydroxylase superfamily)
VAPDLTRRTGNREHDFHHHRNERVAYGTLTGFWDDVLETSVAR